MKIPYTLIGVFSLGGFPDNDGWGNYTCYINGELV